MIDSNIIQFHKWKVDIPNLWWHFLKEKLIIKAWDSEAVTFQKTVQKTKIPRKSPKNKEHYNWCQPPLSYSESFISQSWQIFLVEKNKFNIRSFKVMNNSCLWSALMTLLARIQILLLTLQDDSSLKRYSYKSILLFLYNESLIDLNFWWSHTFPPILYFSDANIRGFSDQS